MNEQLSGRHEFKVADAGWKTPSTFGKASGNFSYTFDGDHTVRLGFDTGQPRLTVGARTFANPVARAVTDPVALSLRVDSRALLHKAPFGAVPAGTRVDYSVAALPGVDRLTLVIEKRRLEGNQKVLDYTKVARLPMQRVVARERELERFTAHHVYANKAVYGHWFEAVIAGNTFVLQNNPDPVFWTREKGSGGVAAVNDHPPAASRIRRFRQTVFDPAFTVPAWAPDIVYYVVIPDRFRNGNPRNDPRPGVSRYHQHTVEKHADWNARPFRLDSGDSSDSHFNNDFFGGDLAGLIQQLDYIKSLGANTIYMTPVFKAASNHKYDTADYRHIDPEFGSNADFTRVTREAASRGMRVIAATRLNHTGTDSLYFNRYGNHGTEGAFQGGRIQLKLALGWLVPLRQQANRSQPAVQGLAGLARPA